MDKNYYRYKWADAEIMKKDKQNPIMKEVTKLAGTSATKFARMLNNIDKL